MRHILSGPIHRSRIFFAPDNGGESGGTATTEAAPDLGNLSSSPSIGHPDTTDRVPGEVSPNFSKLKGKTEEPHFKKLDGKETPAAEPEKTPKEAEKPAKAAEKVEKPAKTADPKDAKASKTPAADASKAASEPKTEKPAKVADKAPEKATEAAAPAKETVKETPAAETKTVPGEIPDKDDDIDAIQANPGAPTAIVKSINDMKGLLKQTRTVARQAREDILARDTEIAALKAQAGKLTPEAEGKVKRAEEILMTFEAENNEGFRQEYDTKIVKSEETLFGMLKAHGLTDTSIDEIKRVGVENWDKWDKWTDKDGIEHPGVFDILKGLPAAKLAQAMGDREKAIDAKKAKLTELATNREQAMQEFTRKEQDGRLDWAKKVEGLSNKLLAGEDWILEEQIPADATEEEKAAIETGNAEKKKLSEKWVEYVRSSYNREPEKTAEIVMKALKTDFISSQLEDTSTKLERAMARIEELETRIASAKTAGRMAHTPTTTDTNAVRTEKSKEIGGDGETAIRAFPWGKGRS